MRVIDIDTPLEPDKLLFYRMTGREELSRMTEYELELLSLDPKINLDEVLGGTVNIKVALPDDEIRYFNGFVTRFSQDSRMHGRYYVYHASVRPWLWFLTLTTDCKIFQEKNVPDILKEVFGDHAGIADVKFELTDSYGPWEYCVQYRETDFNFVSRLMETEGIYYYFKHADKKHTLVIADSYSAHPMAKNGEVPFMDRWALVQPERDQVNDWSHSHDLLPGKYALTDFHFEKPNVGLEAKNKVKRPHALADYEIYDYPGDYVERQDGESYVRTRMQEIQAKFARARGSTNAKTLAPGYLFTLTSHGRDDQNGEYLMISAEYDIRTGEYETGESSGAEYRCQFTAMTSDQPFRAERLTPKPIVHGPQTAITGGPSGEIIHVDRYGRVKVQFHWDRYGKRDDRSSCWIRVSQNSGGKGWGGMFIPHVKQEVIVQFLEGDPDSPVITGRVYNAENMPPIGLPAGKTQSIIRDHGANEIRMEGDGGSQRISIYSPTSETWFSMGAPKP